jgi:hypothetical protein
LPAFDCKIRGVLRSLGPSSRIPALAGAALLACALASAQPAGLLSVAGGDRLTPGSELAVTWTIGAGRGRGRDEMELVLSLDGGRTFPIRVTGRIAPDAASVVWRVPALPTERAVLALRAGDDEESDTEEVVAVSDAFAIASPRSRETEVLYAVDDEWRTREALEGAPVRPLPRDIEPDGEDGQLAPKRLDADDEETPPAAGEFRPSRDGASLLASPDPALEPGPSPAPPRPPLPLRL